MVLTTYLRSNFLVPFSSMALASPMLAGTSDLLRALLDTLMDKLGSLSGNQLDDHSAVLQDLRHACNTPFCQDSRTEQLLLDIWNVAFPVEPLDAMCKGDHWKRLGFQSADPFSDIRAGQLGPCQLHYFASNYPMQLQQLAREARDSGYPFACSCFNISQIIALFFNLNEKPAMNPVAGARIASRRQLSNFARLCNVSSGSARTVLDELFCILVQKLHHTWKSMQATGECDIMDFSRALRKIHDSNAAFWKVGHSGLADLDDLLVEQGTGDVDGTSVASRLHAFLTESLRDLLHVFDAHIPNAVTAIEAIFGGRKSSMLAYPDTQARMDMKRFGEYVPPVAPQVETSALKNSQLCIVEPHTPIPIVNHVPALRSADAFDSDAFFRDWGLTDDKQGQNNDLDAFLDTCLEAPRMVAA